MSAAREQPFVWQKVAVPFSGGVDTRTDRKMVSAAKLGLCENVVFTTPNTLRKRYGYAGLAATIGNDPNAVFAVDSRVNNSRALATRGNELLVFDENGPLSYVRGRWCRSYTAGGADANGGGACAPAGVSMRFAPKLRQDMTLADRGTAFGVTVFAWVAETGIVYVSAIDTATGATLLVPSCIDSQLASRPRIVVVGQAICVLWLREATGLLQMQVYQAKDVTQGMGFSVTLPPSITVANDVNTGVPVYDACSAAGRIFLAYNSSTATTIKFAHVDVNGATDGGFTSQSTASAVTALGVACNTSGSYQVAIAWAMDGNSHIDCRMYDVAKTALFAVQTLNTANTGFKNLGMVFGIGDQALVCFEIGGASPWLQTTWTAHIRVDGAVIATAALFMRHTGLAGKPFQTPAATTINGTGAIAAVCIPVVFESTLQTTYFVVTAATSSTAGYGKAVLARMLPGVGGGLTTKAHLPGVDTLGARTFGLVLLRRFRTSPGTPSYDRAIVDCTIDMGVTGYQMATIGNVLYVAGGFLGEYDGTQAAEAGFHLYPENVTAAQGAGGLLTALATYNYRVYFEYINAQGQRELSTTAASVAITLTGANGTITLTVPTLVHSSKVKQRNPFASERASACVGIVVYRTLANQSLIYYRVSDPNINSSGANAFLVNDPTADTVTFTDQLSDATAATHETDYKSAGLLDNVTPPPCSLIAVGNARCFLSGFADDPNLIWASQYRSFGEALRWSDAITISMPDADDGQPITALGALGDSLIVFRKTHCYTVGGDGPDNTGKNGSFTPARIISDDIGCPYPKSLVRIPIGLMFMSRKGIYLLGNDMTLGYVGADVEAYNGETITAAVALTDVHEVRFTTTNRTLVYNYLAKQWSTFTVAGIHACLWQDRHVVLGDTSGTTRAELAGTFQDGTFDANGPGPAISYPMAIETAWIHIGNAQEQQRVRRVQFLGEWMGQHSALVRVAYNYEGSSVSPAWADTDAIDISSIVGASHYGDDATYGNFSALVPGTFGGTTSSAGRVATQVYQFRVIPRRQRCQAIKLRFEETARIDPAGLITYPLLEGARLNEIALEVGQRGGLWHPGADRVVGG